MTTETTPERATPETDALWAANRGSESLLRKAKNLELQRDELLEALEAQSEACMEMSGTIDMLLDKLDEHEIPCGEMDGIMLERSQEISRAAIAKATSLTNIQ